MWWWFHIRLHRGCSVLAGLFLFLAVFSGSVALHEDTSIFSCAIMLLSCIFLTSFVSCYPGSTPSVLITASLSSSVVRWTTHELVPQVSRLCIGAKFGRCRKFEMKLTNCPMLWKKKKKTAMEALCPSECSVCAVCDLLFNFNVGF